MPEIKGTDIQFDLSDKVIILVDDVLYSGRTIRAALDEKTVLKTFYHKTQILVDRGHRELPSELILLGKISLRILASTSLFV